MTQLPGLILFSHGSLLCGSSRLHEIHSARLRQTGRYGAVEPGYLNYSEPPLEEAIARCEAAGCTRIIIVPYFLVAGKFVTVDLPKRLQSAMSLFPNLEFRIARAIENEPHMLNAIEQVLTTAVDPREWQSRTIAAARAQCELKPDCPLYKSPLCRAAESL